MHYQNSKIFQFIQKLINLKSLIKKIGFARAKYIIDFLRMPTFLPTTGEIEVAKEYFSRNETFWQFFRNVNQELKAKLKTHSDLTCHGIVSSIYSS